MLEERGERYYPQELEDAINSYIKTQGFNDAVLERHILARNIVRLFNNGGEEQQIKAIQAILTAVDGRAMYQLIRGLPKDHTNIGLAVAPNGEPEPCPDCSAPLIKVIVADTGRRCPSCNYSRF